MHALKTLVFALFGFAATVMQAGQEIADISAKDLKGLEKTPIGGTYSLVLPNSPTTFAQVRLKRIDVYAPDAKILVARHNGYEEIARSGWSHFIADKSHGAADPLALSISADGKQAVGFFLYQGEHYLIERISGYKGLRLGVKKAFVPDKNGKVPDWNCGGEQVPPMSWFQQPDHLQRDLERSRAWLKSALAKTASKAAVIAVDTDNELLSLKFSNDETNANNYIAQLMAGMNAVYEADLDVTLTLGTVILRPSTAADPYSSAVGSPVNQAKLQEFGNWWQANQSATARVFAMMLSGKETSTSSASGMAWVLGFPGQVYCDYRNGNYGGYSFTQVFRSPAFPASLDVSIVAHELGHNFGAQHTHCTDNDAMTSGLQPIDQCNSGETFFDGFTLVSCHSGPTSCPVGGGTLMSYCHNVGGCGRSSNFHPTQRSALQTRVAENYPSCITPAATVDPVFENGFED